MGSFGWWKNKHRWVTQLISLSLSLSLSLAREHISLESISRSLTKPSLHFTKFTNISTMIQIKRIEKKIKPICLKKPMHLSQI